MSGENIREVVIRLMAEVDDATPKAFDSVAKQAIEAQKKVTDAHKKGARAQAQEQQRTAKEIARENTLAARQTARNYERAWKAEQQQLKEKVAAEKKARQELIRSNTQAARNQARIYERQWKAEQKQLKEKVAAEKKAAREIAQAQRDARSQYNQASAKLEAMNDRMGEATKQTLSGVTGVARGIAMLGLAGEESTEKLLRGLVKVEGAFSAIRSSIDVVQGASRAWKAYTTAVETAAAAQAALHAAQAISGAGAAKGVTQGVARQTVGKVGGNLASSAVGGAAGAGALKAGGMIGGGKLAGALAAGGALAVTTAKLAAVTAGAIVSVETWGDMFKYGFGKGASPGSLSDKIATAEASIADWVGRQFGIDHTGSVKTQRRTDQLQADIAARQQREQFSATRFGLQYNADLARRGAEQFGRDELFDMGTPRQRFEAAQSTSQQMMVQLARAREQREHFHAQRDRFMATGQGMNPTNATIAGADQVHTDAAERAAAAKLKEFHTARELAELQVRSARETINAINTRRNLLAQEAQEIRDRTRSAKERFGSLDVATQSRLISIKLKADAGDRLTREEENELARFSDLKPVGNIVSRGRLRRAEEGGWGGFVGKQQAQRAADQDRRVAMNDEAIDHVLAEHRAEMGNINAAIRSKIQMDLDMPNKLDIEVNADFDKFTRQVVDDVQAILDERMHAAKLAIQEGVNQKLEEIQVQRNSRDLAERAQMGAM